MTFLDFIIEKREHDAWIEYFGINELTSKSKSDALEFGSPYSSNLKSIEVYLDIGVIVGKLLVVVVVVDLDDAYELQEKKCGVQTRKEPPARRGRGQWCVLITS